MGEPTLNDVLRVRPAVGRLARRTPLIDSLILGRVLGADVALKAENLQRTGAFKIRGAVAKIAALGDEARHGLVAASAGNHAQALALAAREYGTSAEVYMPTNAAIGKVEACVAYGGIVRDGGESVETAVVAARQRAEETGRIFCHPYDDESVVAGQGTLGLELVEDVGGLDQVIVPLGGGGLLAGVAVAVKNSRPDVRVVGVQASVCAPFVTGSAPLGAVSTLADGIAVKEPGVTTRPLIERFVDEVVMVEEGPIADAMMLLAERGKLLVEGGGAVGVAALLQGLVRPRSGTTCVVLSGGNVDLGVIPSLVRRHETKAGRRLLVFVRIPDRPGALATVTRLIAESGANIIEVAHVREGLTLGVRESGLDLTLEVKGRRHAEEVLDKLAHAGHEAKESRHR
jgi:threonine dehydratase